MTSKKDQQQYWARDEPYRFITVGELAEAFKSFHIGLRVKESLATPFDKSKSHPAALTKRKYGTTTKELLKACTRREILLMKRNSFVYVFKVMQVSYVSILTSNFFSTRKNEVLVHNILFFYVCRSCSWQSFL